MGCPDKISSVIQQSISKDAVDCCSMSALYKFGLFGIDGTPDHKRQVKEGIT
jgi:hypothetical protein